MYVIIGRDGYARTDACGKIFGYAAVVDTGERFETYRSRDLNSLVMVVAGIIGDVGCSEQIEESIISADRVDSMVVRGMHDEHFEAFVESVKELVRSKK